MFHQSSLVYRVGEIKLSPSEMTKKDINVLGSLIDNVGVILGGNKPTLEAFSILYQVLIPRHH